MDAIAQLALMQKAQKVFGGDSTFLSFPVTPLQYTQADLSFVQNFNVPRLKEFSLLVNLLPTGEAWQPLEARYLWEVYGDVLRGHGTQLAQSTRTPQEETQYQAAVQFLTVTGANGWPEPSPALRAYNQFRDQSFVLQERYATAKLTGETSLDSAVREHWQKVEEPLLRQQIQDLKTRWINEGSKQEVEAAQETRSRLGAKNPNTTWGDWQSRFNLDIDALTGTDGVSFYPSSFSPMNALESGSWQPFTLTKDEVEAMVKAAPADLRSRLAADRQTSDIESISLEFSSAAIVRTWLTPDLFKARFWRFSDHTQQLSDGKTPPAGRCPAYVSALVFARNITIKRRSQPTPGQQPTSPGNTAQTPPLVVEKLEFSQAVHALKLQPDIRVIAPVQPTPVTRPVLNQPTAFQPVPNVAVSKAAINPTLAQSARVPIAPQTLKGHQFQATTLQSAHLSGQLRNLQVQPVQPVAANANPPLKPINPAISQELTAQTFRRLQHEAVVRPTLPKTPETPKPPSEPTQTTETKTGPDQIYILAFICKPLPLSPDPDTTLSW